MLDLVFLLYELPPPLGKRSSRVKSEIEKSETDQKKNIGSRQQEKYLINLEKKIILKKIDALDLLRGLKIKVYADPVKQINFVDVFKALIKRIFKDKQIEYKLSPKLNSKIKNQWKKSEKNKKGKSKYTAREEQAGIIITKWARKILNSKTSNSKFNQKKKNQKKKKSKQANDPIDQQKAERKKLLKQQAQIIYNIIKNKKVVQEEKGTENDDDYIEKNMFKWKEEGGKEILKSLEDVYPTDSSDSDSQSDEALELAHIQNNIEDRAAQGEGKPGDPSNLENNIIKPELIIGEEIEEQVFKKEMNTTMNMPNNQLTHEKPLNEIKQPKRSASKKEFMLKMSSDNKEIPTFVQDAAEKKQIHIDFVNMDNGIPMFERKEVYVLNKHGKPKRDRKLEDIEKRKDEDNFDYVNNLEDPELMPNAKYDKQMTKMFKLKQKYIQMKEQKMKAQFNQEIKRQPIEARQPRAFEMGGTMETITIDERVLGDKDYQKFELQKNKAEINFDDKMLNELTVNDFYTNTNRLQLKQHEFEKLFYNGENKNEIFKVESVNKKWFENNKH